MKNELILYSSTFCPFCVKVVYYLKRNDIKVEVRDVSNPDYRDELMQGGGKTQVPCLFIDGSPLYESDDIIQWFEDNYE